MKRSFAIFLFLILTACGQNTTAVRTSPSASPSTTETPGPTSEQGPTPSPMPSNLSSSPVSPAPSNVVVVPTGVPTAIDYSAYGIPSSLPVSPPSSSPTSTPSNLTQRTTAPLPKVTSQTDNKTDRKKANTILPPTVITANGIGTARVGMTLGELKQALGTTATLEVVKSFAVDFDAIAVKQQGRIQYYIPYEQSQPLGDGDKIRYLVTDNPSFKTAQGVSPGMSIKQAAQIYGAAKLLMNRAAESREIVRFAQQPQEIIFYGIRPGNDELAGIYPESNDDVLETDRYSDQAKIDRITITCNEAICGAEH